MPAATPLRKLIATPDANETAARVDELFEYISNKGVIAAVQFCADRWGVTTSKSACSRFAIAERGRRADADMMDRLSARATRTRHLSKRLQSSVPTVSKATLLAMDQLIYEMTALNPDDPRLERLVDMFSTLMKAADTATNTKLSLDKFQQETCEKFLAWYQDQRARDIAESGASNADKIAQLRATYYADVDALEKSGTVELPT